MSMIEAIDAGNAEMVSCFSQGFATSVCTEKVECTDMYSELLVGIYLRDHLIFSVVHYGQLLCSSVSCSSQQRGVDSDGMLLTEKRGGGGCLVSCYGAITSKTSKPPPKNNIQEFTK
jgi:hypothetical protein